MSEAERAEDELTPVVGKLHLYFVASVTVTSDNELLNVDTWKSPFVVGEVFVSADDYGWGSKSTTFEDEYAKYTVRLIKLGDGIGHPDGRTELHPSYQRLLAQLQLGFAPYEIQAQSR